MGARGRGGGAGRTTHAAVSTSESGHSPGGPRPPRAEGAGSGRLLRRPAPPSFRLCFVSSFSNEETRTRRTPNRRMCSSFEPRVPRLKWAFTRRRPPWRRSRLVGSAGPPSDGHPRPLSLCDRVGGWVSVWPACPRWFKKREGWGEVLARRRSAHMRVWSSFFFFWPASPIIFPPGSGGWLSLAVSCGRDRVWRARERREARASA